MTTSKKVAVAIVSGGLDSTTLVYHLLKEGYDVRMISFNYGQKHAKELVYARGISSLLELKHEIVDLRDLKHLISNSVLTSTADVPEGHYAEDNMRQTVVPNRNLIMLSIAAGYAVNIGADVLATGVHAGDHFVYPDCRPRFIAAANAAIVVGNAGFGNIPEQPEGTMPTYFIEAPFLHETKTDIAYRALELGVPLHLTWSCYKGGINHCGRCGTCVERLEAIHDAQVTLLAEGIAGPEFMDHTFYDDDEFWKVKIAETRQTEAAANEEHERLLSMPHDKYLDGDEEDGQPFDNHSEVY
jgi:7-cyano-7-deazaguanine synthase